MKKNTAKKKNKVKILVKYGISIPEPDLFTLIKNDAAGTMTDYLEKHLKTIPADIFKISKSVITILREAQDQWSSALQSYIESGMSPADEDWVCKQLATNIDFSKAKSIKPKGKKPVLSNAEVKKIVSLRSKGLSIKAIGKTIHRAEKVVADVVRTLPKKK